MKRQLIFSFIVFIILLSSCNKNKQTKKDLLTQKELLEFHQKYMNKPKKTDIDNINDPKNKKTDINNINKKIIQTNSNKQKPTFPNTLCGRLVSKLYKCELNLIDQNKNLKIVFKRDIKNRKTRRFLTKKEQYLSHCRKTVAKLPKKEVERCLAINDCKAMDKCLTTISKNISGK